MNAWLIAAVALLSAMVLCGLLVFRGETDDRLVGLEMAGVIETLLLIVLAQAMKNANFHDLALAMALLTFGGGLVFVRFLERWL